MARKTRRSAAAAAEAPSARDEAPEQASSSPLSQPEANETADEDEHEATNGLRFNQPLLGRPGKQIPVGELIKRLSSLGQELAGIEQDEPSEELLAALTAIGKEISDTQLVAHKDKGVRAWTAWCAVDLLRLCAPNAPFSQKQLKAIFEMIVKSIFPVLSDPSHAYYEQCNYVLKSLAEVKSIVLVIDLPAAEALIQQIFETFFDTLAGSSKASTGEQIPKAVHYHMGALLTVLVEEAHVIPQEAVDILIAQFLRVDPRILVADDKSKKLDPFQSTLTMKEFPPAYNVAKSICNNCSDKMTQEISKYFNDVILDASKTSNSRDSVDIEDFDVSLAELDDQQLEELSKAHRLLRELWRACPEVLQNVIPQLEQELSTENVQLRVLAVETFGDIVSGIGAAGPPAPHTVDPAIYPPPDMAFAGLSKNENLLTKPSSPQSFSSTHNRAWIAFQSRKQDKSYLVRSAWATAAGRILATNAGGIGLSREDETRLVEDMARLLNDSDERVRLAAVKSISHFSLRELINNLGDSGSVDKVGSVLNNLSERIKDRKPAVRSEAMQLLASIWASAYGEISTGNERVTELLGGIPSKILNSYYTGDPEIVVLMDKVLYSTLLPLQYPPIKSKGVKVNSASQAVNGDAQANGSSESLLDPDTIRAERVLVLAKGLDERARKMFTALPNRQRSVSICLRAYLEWCEKYNGGIMDANEDVVKERLTRIIAEVTKLLPDPARVRADLWKFAKAHDRRAYQLMRFCADAKSDYKTVHNAMKEFLKRIDASLKETLAPLLNRLAILIFNRSHMPTYLDASKSGDKALSDIMHRLLDSVSKAMPSVASMKVSDLYVRIIDQKPSSKHANSAEAASDLKTCANFAKEMPDKMPKGRDLDEAIKAYIQYGTPSEAGKYAVAIGMAQAEKRDKISRVLKEHAVKGYTYGKQGFLPRLAAMSQLALLAPPTKAGMDDWFLDIALDQTLKVDPTTANLDTQDYSWSEDIDDDSIAKCWAIRILTNRLRCWLDQESFPKVATPVLTMLVDLVEKEGDVGGRGKTSSHGKPRIRLQAAKALLKLCRIKLFDSIFTAQHFQKLAEVALDPVFEVRRAFLTKLERYSNHGLLSPRFYTIFFFIAYEPNAAFKLEVVKWIKSRVQFLSSKSETVDGEKKALKMSTTLESVVQRLISLLAHFSDYGDTTAELGELAVYIVFYLGTVANSENVSYIYHIAQRVKTTTDAVGVALGEEGIDFTNRLRVLSDLTSYTIRSYLELYGWTLQSLPGRVSLSTQLFNQITNPLEASDIAAKNNLPADVESIVDNIVHWSKRKQGQGILSLPQALTTKKRKTEADISEHAAKKARKESLPTRERTAVVKSKKGSRRNNRDSDDDDDDDDADEDTTLSNSTANINRRKSGRTSIAQANKSYRERDDSEDDAEMEEANGDDIANPKQSDPANNQPDQVADAEMNDSDDVAEDDPAEEEEEEEDDEAEKTPPSKSKSKKGKPTPKSTVKSSPKTATPAKSRGRAKAAGSAQPVSNSPVPVSSSPVGESAGVRRSARARR